MSPRRQSWTEVVDAALLESPLLVASRAGRRLAVATGVRVPFAMAIDRDWLTLQCALTPEAEHLAPWDVLGLTGDVRGEARLIVVPGQTRIAARADVPLIDGVPVAERVHAACAGMREAVLVCGRHARGVGRARPGQHGDDGGADAGPAKSSASAGAVLRILPASARTAGKAAGPVSGEASTPDLAALLAAVGWRFVQRSPQRYAVDLGVRGQFVQAMVEPHGGDGVRLRAVLATFRSPVAASRAAVGVLLLSTAAAVRLVRGGADRDADEHAVYIESWFRSNGQADELQHALSALAVAGQMVAREVRALADERVAREYLARKGWDLASA